MFFFFFIYWKDFFSIMSTSSKAADILLEAGSSFKRIAELTMELVDPNSSNRLSNSSTSSQKIAIDSSELKRLRDALNRFSSDLDAVSQRIHTNREAATAPQEVERLMSLNSIETNNEQQTKTEDIPISDDNQTDVPMTVWEFFSVYIFVVWKRTNELMSVYWKSTLSFIDMD